MKKILIFTILITTCLQAEEETNDKQKICDATSLPNAPFKIQRGGLRNCKENDLLVFDEPTSKHAFMNMLSFCKEGSMLSASKYDAMSCKLKAEKDFLVRVKIDEDKKK